MKKNLVMLLLLVGLALVLWLQPGIEQHGPGRVVTGLPWQIEQYEDGSSSVFGIHLGKASIEQGRRLFNDPGELALISSSDQDISVEVYFGRYSASGLTGKMILVADLEQKQLQELKLRAARSGANNKYLLDANDLPLVNQALIKSITFIPVVNLEPDVIIKRFGKPNRIIRTGKKVEHYLYPDKGLDILVDEKGRELLQYVVPRDFALLSKPLEALADKQTEGQ